MGLWQFYVADFTVPDNNCQAFMDDIIFWEQGETYEETLTALQLHASRVDHWLEEHQMRLNEVKSRLISNKSPISSRCLQIQGCSYYPVKRLRYLGINLESKPEGPDLFLNLTEVKSDLRRRCSLLTKASRWLPSHMCHMFARSIIMGKLNSTYHF